MSSFVGEEPGLAPNAVSVDPAVSLLPASHPSSPSSLCEKEEPDLHSTRNEGECGRIVGPGDGKSEAVVVDPGTLLESWPHKSGHAVKELILTEKTYLDSLEEVINVSLTVD